MKSVKRDASSKAWKKSPKVSKKPGKTGKKPAKKSSKVVARDLAVSAMRRVPMPAGSYAPRAGSLAAAVLYVLYVEKARHRSRSAPHGGFDPERGARAPPDQGSRGLWPAAAEDLAVESCCLTLDAGLGAAVSGA